MSQEHELRDQEQATAWLLTGLNLVRVTKPTDEVIQEVQPWIIKTITERPALPPPGVVVDIGHLLKGNPLRPTDLPSFVNDPVRSVLRRYEDHLLGRLVQDRYYGAAVDALARLPLSIHPLGIGLVVSHILDRIQFHAGIAIPQGIVRKLKKYPEKIKQTGFAILQNKNEISNLLLEGYENLAKASAASSGLLSEPLVSILENLNVLTGLSQRMAFSQVAKAASWLGQQMPPTFIVPKSDKGIVPTELEDESTYPTGGFSSISIVGSLENLVTSELIYMDPIKNSVKKIDLFDMRYAEGELLYYTRDESLFVRQRRQISFLLHEDLAGARIKDPGLKWQRLVLLLGLVVCTVRKFVDTLGEEELKIKLVFLKSKAEDPFPVLKEERQLCELILREWKEQDIVAVETSTMEETVEKTHNDVRRAVVQTVICGVNNYLGQWLNLNPDPRVRSSALEIGELQPKLILQDSNIESSWDSIASKLIISLIKTG